MPKATKAQRNKLDALNAKREALMSQIFDLAPTPQTRFSDCLKLASPDLACAYLNARVARDDFERELVSAGRAWRDTFGHAVLN
jgi:hypothetical protein